MTIGLAMITKNSSEDIVKTLSPIKDQFDRIAIVDTGSTDDTVPKLKELGVEVHTVGDMFKFAPTPEELKKMQKIDPEISVDFKVFDFAAARNYSFSLLDTDYIMWLDSDDDVDLSNLKQVLSLMENEEIDRAFCAYQYDQDENGNINQFHHKERIFRNNQKFEWRGTVHEATVPKDGVTFLDMKDDTIVVTHRATNDDHRNSSMTRNYLIHLHEWVRDGAETDPRTLMYLGAGFMYRKNWKLAVQCLLEHIEKGGWDEDKYRSWTKVSDCYRLLEDRERARFALQQAMKERPDFPEAYYKLAEIEAELEDYKKALDYLDIAFRIPQPETLSVTDPAMKYRAMALAAFCYAQTGQVAEAHEVFQVAKKHVPDHDLVKSLAEPVEEAFYRGEYLKHFGWLLNYSKEKDPKKVDKLFDAVVSDLSLDSRLASMKHEYLPPKKWAEDEVAFLCGGLEPWSPESVKTGIGGSEEAIIYLTRELAKLGWKPTVFNTIEEPTEFEGVMYRPVHELNLNDTFNIFVAWRQPALFRLSGLKAKLKLVDMHDTPVGHQEIYPEDLAHIDRVMLKSKFQQELSAHNLPDEKVAIISNGINPDDFKGSAERNPKKVIYASSPDRGLTQVLLDMWPEVLKEVPDAELYWYYGFDSFDKMHSGNPDKMKEKWTTIKKMAEVGCVNGGRIGHKELAREFMSSNVWFYPTGFAEINCITALKAQAGGATPITTGCCALKETVMDEEKDWGENTAYYSEECRTEMIRRLVKALKEPETEEVRQARADKVTKEYSWSEIARRWAQTLTGTDSATSSAPSSPAKG